MDRAKVRGEYASAYKLSSHGSSMDKKTQRVHRRSIEQKELRLVSHNKRRPLADLSPVQEGDLSAVNKNYKDKTPVKATGQKASNRLEQLMKWKKERELKKKMENESRTKNNPVFRVSKAVNHQDIQLFKKDKTSIVHQVKPVPCPKTTGPKALKSQPIQVTKPTMGTSKPKPENTHKPTTRTRHTSGNQAHPAKIQKKETQSSKPAPETSRPARSTRNASRQPPAPTRTTRQSTRNKTANAPAKTKSKVTSSASKTVDEPEVDNFVVPNNDMTKVTTDRGGLDSFAPAEFSFDVSSFVFKPLSPGSAAGFLYPGQDNSCTSFLESNPKRASTPKRENKRGTSEDRTKVTDKCSNTMLLNNTGLGNGKGENETMETNTVAADDTIKASPKHKTRQSRSSSRKNKNTSVDETLKESVDNSLHEKTVTNDASNSKKRDNSRSSKRVTRSSQRSVNDSGLVLEESQLIHTPSMKDTTVEKTKRTRSSGRRSIASTSKLEKCEQSDETESKLKTPRRSSRRSVASTSKLEVYENATESDGSETMVSKTEQVQETESETDADEKKSKDTAEGSSADEVFVTPKDVRTRSVRKSVRMSTKSDDDLEAHAEQENIEMPKSALKKGPKSDRKVKHVTLSTDLSDDGEEEITRRSSRHSRRSMPSSGQVKKTTKKYQRKSMLPRLPKSPEEWVDLLSNSPMVEMTRRTPKRVNLSMPTLNFDDLDLEQPNFMDDKKTTTETPMETDTAVQPPSDSVPESDQVSTDLPSTPAALPVPMAQPVSSPVPQCSVQNEAEPSVSTTEDMTKASSVSTDTVENKDSGSKPEASETVQVGEVSSTQGSNDEVKSEEHDVMYFRNLVVSETKRLGNLCQYWNESNDDSSLTEDVHGQIRTVVGQAQLLMDQRFKQFIGLVDNCEFKRGEKETTCTDLQGFWDMIYFQVEDVDIKFQNLAKLQANNWVDPNPVVVKKQIKKKIVKPTVAKPKVKSKFAAFRAQMMKQKDAPPGSPVVAPPEEEKVFEIPGFFRVASPVRTPKPHCEGGTPKKATPAQRSSENSEEKPANTNSGSISNTPSVPAGTELFLHRPFVRKSYAPTVPSPLLQDITPQPRPARTCTQKTPVPTPTDDVTITRNEETGESASKRVKTTPKRRSLRPRKSVNFSEPISDSTEDTTMVVPQTPTDLACDEEDVLDISHDSFSKYLQPVNTSTTASPRRKSTGRRASLKASKTAEKQRSRHSVHFSSPSREDDAHMKMPRTPFNRNSIVEQKRITRSSIGDKNDIFTIDNVDNDENTPPQPKSFRSPRPSLLFTPPQKDHTPVTNSDVPTATLVSFTP